MSGTAGAYEWHTKRRGTKYYKLEAAEDIAGSMAGQAANEIQDATLLREQGRSFFYLPMFGFADETEIPL